MNPKLVCGLRRMAAQQIAQEWTQHLGTTAYEAAGAVLERLAGDRAARIAFGYSDIPLCQLEDAVMEVIQHFPEPDHPDCDRVALYQLTQISHGLRA